jgi:hypothetical protein
MLGDVLRNSCLDQSTEHCSTPPWCTPVTMLLVAENIDTPTGCAPVAPPWPRRPKDIPNIVRCQPGATTPQLMACYTSLTGTGRGVSLGAAQLG